MAELPTIIDKRQPQGLLGSPQDELQFRIHGPTGQGHVVVVRVSKCTIGSADSCSLPLNAPGIQPVHCVILRGQHGTVVRSLAPGTTLNGMQIQDAPLSSGDRLQIGPYELEVLSTVAKEDDPLSPPTTQPIPGANAPILTSDANHSVTMDPPSSDDLATAIANRINRVEGQLEELQQHGGQATIGDSRTEEIKLAQEAIASLSRQLDCERGRNVTTLEAIVAERERLVQELADAIQSAKSLVAERERLVQELADATQSANDLCRDLEQIRNEHVENDVTSELISQRIAEVSDSNAQRIAEASDLQAQRIAEVSAEVERLAETITETGQHHQQARDQGQANNEALAQVPQ